MGFHDPGEDLLQYGKIVESSMDDLSVGGGKGRIDRIIKVWFFWVSHGSIGLKPGVGFKIDIGNALLVEIILIRGLCSGGGGIGSDAFRHGR